MYHIKHVPAPAPSKSNGPEGGVANIFISGIGDNPCRFCTCVSYNSNIDRVRNSVYTDGRRISGRYCPGIDRTLRNAHLNSGKEGPQTKDINLSKENFIRVLILRLKIRQYSICPSCVQNRIRGFFSYVK